MFWYDTYDILCDIISGSAEGCKIEQGRVIFTAMGRGMLLYRVGTEDSLTRIYLDRDLDEVRDQVTKIPKGKVHEVKG